ncbi:tyrosine-type recombinase/integrase [Nocardia terpenica]|nr:tyrosine-type recombinase/integrase [Nocardia terpenica]
MLTPQARTRTTDGTVAWQVPFYYRDENNKRRHTSETFDEYAEAQRFCDLVDSIGINEALKVLEFQRGARSQVVLLTDWLTHYVDEICRAGEYMQRKYRSYIHNDITPFFGQGFPLEALTPEMDAAWVVHLSEEQGNAPKTVHNKHGFLSGAMNSAAGRRPVPLIGYNPCATTRLPAWRMQEADIFEEREWELFDLLVGERWRPQCEFALMSMARPGEVSALRVGDVDRCTGDVDINKAWKDFGSRRKLGEPKTAHGFRVVNVPLETLALIDLNRASSELLFQTKVGTPVTASVLYERAFQPALRRLDGLAKGHFGPFGRHARWEGADPEFLLATYRKAVHSLLAKRITPYTLRHTMISWKLQRGDDLIVVSRDAGHESTRVTELHYSHVLRSASRASTAKARLWVPRVRAVAEGDSHVA